MKNILKVIFIAFFLHFPLSSNAELSWYECNEIEGAKIIAEDGTYLGTMGDSYNSDSIYNDYSSYGNEYGDSIWNEYSEYGNEYSSQSPFNDYASDPPVLLKDGEVVGKLSTDKYDYNAIDPSTAGSDCGWWDTAKNVSVTMVFSVKYYMIVEQLINWGQ